MPTTRQSINAAVLLTTLMAMAVLAARPAEAQDPSGRNEQQLIAVLRSDAPAAEKAVVCKYLSVVGSSEAVPELAKLLADEKLASWSRIALEVIPGAAADEALRKAADSLQGRLLVGAINSIGVRRDAAAVDLLSGRLKDQDADVASAAAVALGRIGNAAAAKSLRQTLAAAPIKVRSAVAEGCVLCAERFLAEGNAAEAAAIYDEVRNADVPKQRKLEATRGAILARREEGIPLLVEQLRSSDKALFQIGLRTAREFPGREVDQALAAELDRAPPEWAALVILAMADRRETVVLPAVLKAAANGAKPVRLAAIGALGRVGNATCVSPLLEIAVESDADLARTAKDALSALPGETVDKEIMARLDQAAGKTYPVLIELVGQRRINAVPALLKAVNHSDAAVRSAALTALGNTVTAKDLSALISQVVAPTYADGAATAQQALKTAAVRMPDREACAAELAAALERSPAPTKPVLLETMGAVGGTKALQSLHTAAKSSDSQLQEVSSRLLGEWMTIDAAPVLLDLAKTGKPGDKYQVRALRGYIRIARQFTMPEPERAEMCRAAMAVARQPAEQKLVLEVLTRYPSVETLKLAVEATKTPELKADALNATQAIAQKLGKTDEVREVLSKAGVDK
ncbi:MAG: PBS lyase [Planctomycetes bacterium]|nr:PBS lyase [Planctomycetota bacterium]